MLVLRGSDSSFNRSYGGDRDTPQPWTLPVQIPSTLVHAIAIIATIFRLLYRKRLSKFAWEDTWAALALICDFGCLASIWIQAAPNPTQGSLSSLSLKSNWLLSLTITSILWFARMSILSSVIRIANPARKLRFVAYCFGTMFLAMYAGLLAQKILLCVKDFCRFTNPVAIAQLVTDVISDIILVVVPVRFLRDIRLQRDRRILIISAFSASLLISVITILHSILLFQEASNATIIIGHVKAALALFLCNALVLVTFVYRCFQKSSFEMEYSSAQGSEVGSDVVQFTSVIELQSKPCSAIQTSVVQSRGDTAHAKGSTLNIPGELVNSSNKGSSATPRDTEDPRRSHMRAVGNTSGEQQETQC